MLSEISDLIRIREKYSIPRSLVSKVTQISSQCIFRYEKRGVVPILVHRMRIVHFLNLVRDIENGGTN